MRLVLRVLLSGLAVVLLSEFLDGVNVDNYKTAIIVAVVVAVLNLIVKPLLVLFTLPVTVFTLGLFMLVINAVIIMLADYLIDGFSVTGIWSAMGFSVLLSILQAILAMFLKKD